MTARPRAKRPTGRYAPSACIIASCKQCVNMQKHLNLQWKIRFRRHKGTPPETAQERRAAPYGMRAARSGGSGHFCAFSLHLALQ